MSKKITIEYQKSQQSNKLQKEENLFKAHTFYDSLCFVFLWKIMFLRVFVMD